MAEQKTRKVGHKKLKIFGIALLVIILGFFIYKYTYIYLERQKYEKAELAINKVADDLRAQGVETTPFKNCERAQVKFGEGFISCHVGIIYEGNDGILTIKEPLEKFIKSAVGAEFEYTGGGELSPTRHPIVVGDQAYILRGSKLGCSLSYDKQDDLMPDYSLTLSCGRSSKFKIL